MKELSMESQPTLKLGLFSYSYHLAFGAHEVFRPTVKMDLYKFIDNAKEMGLDGVQIDAVHLLSHDDAYIDNLRAYVEQNGLYVELGITGIDEANLRHSLELAHRLGAARMSTNIQFNPRVNQIDVGKEVSTAVDALNSVKGTAQRYGIKIAVENHCDLRTDELIDLIKQVDTPFVGVCVDLGNFMIHLENPVESVRKLAPYIVNTHFKDYAFSMENWGFKAFGVALGEGAIDLGAILKILVEDSRLDRIMLEIPVEKAATEEETLAKEDRAIRESVRYAREVLAIR